MSKLNTSMNDSDSLDDTLKPPPDDDGIEFDSIEVAGIIKDAAGNTWAIPEKEETDWQYKSIYEIPHPDPRFHYQFENESDVRSMMGDQFVPVTRKEIGIPEFKSMAEYGQSIDEYHRVGGQVCLKKPKVLVDRTYAAQKRMCDAAVSATEPLTPDANEAEDIVRARENAEYGPGQRRSSLKRTVVNVRPKNPASERVQGKEE